ncbi:MAG: tRNA (adenosine(37)-N6)-threonylcarbamoyltransferase complex dimerization subunit type 1 TsaB [Pyrinomonadaceae bacterium]|nr:tRNA (adenosine(37)-N6)-threonylcarbamoyltransferase complex dimerization subunit type 1 TsaB [Pyrinomonadaceae bacterium]
MPLILSLETATRSGSIALMNGEKVIASVTGNAQDSHSATLLHQIEMLLEKSGLSLPDIDLFATASGPGSFTGLRIGLATVKALSATLNRPCIGIPTLQAIAYGAGASDATCALIPAGRGEVFAQLFKVAEDGKVSELSEATHLPPTILLDRMSDRLTLLWAGHGARENSDLISERARELKINFSSSEPNGWTLAAADDALAEHVAHLALQESDNDEAHQPENLHAIYVRPSDAELKK